jgi:hypothetical protein
MLIKLVFVLFVNIFFLHSGSLRAEINNYIFGNNEHKLTKRIDSFFGKYPNEKKVIWQPEIKGKSRYAISIPKDGYQYSKKYFDFSDLYYLSQKIDNGLDIQPNKLKYIDFIISKNNSKLSFNQNFSSNINVGLFFQQKEKKSFGLAINKDLIISRNILSNFEVEKANYENARFNIKFVRLSNNENAEFYGNINHKFQSDILDLGVGHTWFEIANQFDFTLAIQEYDKKVESEFYATFGDDRKIFQIGLNQIRDNSNMNMFINFKFENTLNKNKFKTNGIITSKNNILGLRNLSLKSFRKKNLDMLWKKYINYN